MVMCVDAYCAHFADSRLQIYLSMYMLILLLFYATKCPVRVTGLVDLLRRDFRTMMYYDYCQVKSFQQGFQSL